MFQARYKMSDYAYKIASSITTSYSVISYHNQQFWDLGQWRQQWLGDVVELMSDIAAEQ